MDEKLFSRFVDFFQIYMKHDNMSLLKSLCKELIEELRIYCINNPDILAYYRFISLLEIEIELMRNNNEKHSNTTFLYLKKISEVIRVEKEIIDYKIHFSNLITPDKDASGN